MPELQRLRADHAAAVLAFELANRAYFAAFISDRGDEFFDQFTEQHSALMAEQEAGVGAYYVLVAEDGSVLGRFNLYRFEDGTAELGYRVARHAGGRGVATATVRELCRLAAVPHGLHTLRAATTHENTASQKVLTKAGFVPAGPGAPAHLGGKQGIWYQCDLTPRPHDSPRPDSGLPSTGIIFGTPVTPGTFTVTVTAADPQIFDTSGSTKFEWTVSEVTVTNPETQNTDYGTAVSLPLRATSTAGLSLTYGATGLPPESSLDSSTGVISGTLIELGPFSVTVTAQDTTGASGTAVFTWNVNSVLDSS